MALMTSFIENRLCHTDVHEKKIHATFEGRTHYTPDMVKSGGTFGILLFANRSGSNLLAEYLNASGLFVGFAEHLNFDFVDDVAKTHDIRDFPEYIRRMNPVPVGDKRTFGFKSSLSQLTMLWRWNIPAMFDETKIINIEREDLVEQAVSMSIAEQTGSWSSEITRKADPYYDFDNILAKFNHMAVETSAKRAAISLLRVPSITLTYQMVVDDPAYCVQQACELFEHSATFTLPKTTKLKKQANALNAEFSARFREEMQTRMLHL